tara:strand:+ start:20 stop:550 length:531 start_codon:yes stop_codon:yes gene_type:complete
VIQQDLFFNVFAKSKEEHIDLCDCPIYFGSNGRRKQDLNATSDFLCSIPKNKYTVYKTGGTHLLPMYRGRNDFPYIVNNNSGKTLKVSFSRSVYPSYGIDNGIISKRIYSHRIFAMAFIPNELPEDNYNVDHYNEDKLDYSITNLRWLSASDNMKNIRGNASNSSKEYKVYGSRLI